MGRRSLLNFINVKAKLGQNIVLSDDGSYCTVKDESIKKVIYPDSTDEDVEGVKELMVPQSTIPLATPLNITEENYRSIPMVYIWSISSAQMIWLFLLQHKNICTLECLVRRSFLWQQVILPTTVILVS